MITGLLITIVITLVVILLSSLIARSVKIHLIYVRFKRASKGLPMLHETWSPGGNSHQMMFDPYILLKLDAMHRHYGKTFGWMYSVQPSVSTVDLDLLKTINIDEQDKHVNREDHSVLIKEVESDSIVLVQDDQWRRIRRAITPSFT